MDRNWISSGRDQFRADPQRPWNSRQHCMLGSSEDDRMGSPSSSTSSSSAASSASVVSRRARGVRLRILSSRASPPTAARRSSPIFAAASSSSRTTATLPDCKEMRRSGRTVSRYERTSPRSCRHQAIRCSLLRPATGMIPSSARGAPPAGPPVAQAPGFARPHYQRADGADLPLGFGNRQVVSDLAKPRGQVA